MNLSGAFDNAARPEDWLTAVTDLAASMLPNQAAEDRRDLRLKSPLESIYTPPRRCMHHVALAHGASSSTAETTHGLHPKRP